MRLLPRYNVEKPKNFSDPCTFFRYFKVVFQDIFYICIILETYQTTSHHSLCPCTRGRLGPILKIKKWVSNFITVHILLHRLIRLQSLMLGF